MHENTVKLADFGFSRLLDKSSFAKTILGSPLNMAPEILEAVPYTSKADIWSLGVCFYNMLYNKYPFVGKDLNDLYNNIKFGELEFPEDIEVSSECKDILKRMLVSNPENRASWSEVFQHEINNKLDVQISLSNLYSVDSVDETMSFSDMRVEDIILKSGMDNENLINLFHD